MTTKKFSNALGNIGENYINEAATYSGKRKKETWVKWVSIAACLSLVVAGGIFGNIFNIFQLYFKITHNKLLNLSDRNYVRFVNI